MNNTILRVGALFIHVIVNIVIVAYVTRYDISGSWLSFAGFMVLLFILLIAFIKHLISFISFIKTKTK